MPRAAVLLVIAVAGCGGGEKLNRQELPGAPATIQVRSSAFADGGTIPARYTCDGAGRMPAVRFAGVPRRSRELAVVVVDPDAPGGRYVHLTEYRMPARAAGAIPPLHGREGQNSGGGDGWTPPCPPKGDKPHAYVWNVYALGAPTHLAAGARPSEVVHALNGKIIARGTLTGRFTR